MRRWIFHLQNQWKPLLKPHLNNWIDFTLCECSFEIDRYFGHATFTLALLGFSLSIVYTYDMNNKNQQEWEKEAGL